MIDLDTLYFTYANKLDQAKKHSGTQRALITLVRLLNIPEDNLNFYRSEAKRQLNGVLQQKSNTDVSHNYELQSWLKEQENVYRLFLAETEPKTQPLVDDSGISIAQLVAEGFRPSEIESLLKLQSWYKDHRCEECCELGYREKIRLEFIRWLYQQGKIEP